MKGDEYMTSLLTYEEAARLLHVRPCTLRRWVRDGQVPYIRRGSKYVRFTEEELCRFIRRLRVEAKSGAKPTMGSTTDGGQS
jgi:excisionase family DNA binding protein